MKPRTYGAKDMEQRTWSSGHGAEDMGQETWGKVMHQGIWSRDIGHESRGMSQIILRL